MCFAIPFDLRDFVHRLPLCPALDVIPAQSPAGCRIGFYREHQSVGNVAVVSQRQHPVATEMGMSVKVLGSTDLTHYGPNYGFMPQGKGEKAAQWVREENDRKVIDAMIAMDPERVLHEAASRFNACCSGAVASTIAAARQLGAVEGHTVSYTTSYDKSPGDSLVGYVGVVF